MRAARPGRFTRVLVATLLVAVVVTTGGCSTGDVQPSGGDSPRPGGTTGDPPVPAPRPSDTPGPEAPTSDELAAAFCAGDEPPRVTGSVANPDLTEVSGLVASSIHPGMLWSHNDSGHDPVIYAVGSDGADLGTFEVTGAEALDWEDIAEWTDPASGTSYLYLADTGDFHLPGQPGDATARRDHVSVYRVEEPTELVPGGATAPATRYEFTYPGRPYDSEAFLVDPVTGDFYFLTKGWNGSPAPVFRARAPEPGSRTELTEVGAIVLGSPLDLITGADVSVASEAGADTAGVVVVRTYTGVLVFPLRNADGDGSMAGTFDVDPCTGASVSEPQGEAIAVAADLSGYFTTSEGGHPSMNWFPASR